MSARSLRPCTGDDLVVVDVTPTVHVPPQRVDVEDPVSTRLRGRACSSVHVSRFPPLKKAAT